MSEPQSSPPNPLGYYALVALITLALGYGGALLIGSDQRMGGLNIPLRPYMGFSFVLAALLAASTDGVRALPKSFLRGAGSMLATYLIIAPLLAYAAFIGDPQHLYVPTALTLLLMGASMAPLAYLAAHFVRRFRAGV